LQGDDILAIDYKQLTLSNFRAEKDYYSVREMSELYGVSRPTIRAWIKSGYLKGEMYDAVTPGAKRGRYRIYPKGMLDDIEVYRSQLIEMSMQSWPKLLAKLKKQ
jgi:DNA-binding transcriptional MerR regulator